MPDAPTTGGDTPAPPAILENRVRFAETDLHGHAFYGEYFTYLDETFNAFLRRIDYPYDRMHAEGWTTNVVHAELDYRAPAAYEDVIENRLGIDSIGERSLTATYEARIDGEAVASGEVVHVAVAYGRGDDADDEEGGAIRVPGAFREAVADFQDEPPE